MAAEGKGRHDLSLQIALFRARLRGLLVEQAGQARAADRAEQPGPVAGRPAALRPEHVITRGGIPAGLDAEHSGPDPSDPGRPSTRLRIWTQPGATPPLEWRLYAGRHEEPDTPFLLRGWLAGALPASAFVDGAFRLLLGHPADPGALAFYGAALEAGLEREALLARLALSAEAANSEDDLLLLCTSEPPPG